MTRDMRDPQAIGELLFRQRRWNKGDKMSKIHSSLEGAGGLRTRSYVSNEGPLAKYGDPRALPPTAGGEVDAG